MTTEADILAAVIAHPDDDTPRLGYADYLSDMAGTVECAHCRGTGKPNPKYDFDDRLNYVPGWAKECPPCGGKGWVPDALAMRAEFIRAQCELARSDGHGHGVTRPHGGSCDTCDLLARLAKRERTLLSSLRDHLLTELPTSTPPWAFYLSRQGAGFDDGWTFGLSRGFADRLTCPAADWLAHPDAILAAHPVRWVRLSGWLEEPMASFWLAQGRARVGELRLISNAASEYLDSRWPGVTFDLPPAITTASWETRPPDIRADLRAFRDRLVQGTIGLTPRVGDLVRLADGTEGVMMGDIDADGTGPVWRD